MKNNFFTKPGGLWITAGICCLLWGSAFPSIKKGYVLFNISSGDVPSIILFAGLRFFLAGILTVVIFSCFEKKLLLPSKKSYKSIAVLSLFQTIIQYILFYLGLAYTTGERGSVINALSVFFALFISVFIFKFEKLKSNKIFGCIIGFAGVVIISLDALKKGGGIAGELLIAASSLSYAFSSAFMKKYSKNENPAMLSGWQFVFGGTVLLVTGLALGGRLRQESLSAYLLLVYLAFLSAAAYSLWSILLKYNSVSRVMVCSFMTPVFGYFLSALFSKNKNDISLLSFMALLIVICGIIVVNRDINNIKKC